MLVELHCDKFREKSISFHKGLNVVLGDDVATNSIGKSSLLMVLDFIFGGESILEHNKDIVEEIGEHDYYFELSFSNISYYFRRGTYKPDLIYMCDSKYNELKPISIDEYKTFLKKSYGLDDIELTFRSTVSLFSRVWGKDNLDVKQPLCSFKNQKPTDSIDNLLKLYKRYETIRSLSNNVKSLSDEKTTINKAYRQNLIPKISKTKYKENILKVSAIDSEIKDIKDNLAKYAVNLSEIVNREVSELKNKKDNLLREKSRASIRLNRVRDDLSQNKHIKSKSFSSLVKFFPEANVDRFAEVEEFHSKISKILRSELQESERDLSEMLEQINKAIKDIDHNMAQAFSDIENPSIIIDRVHELANTHSSASAEISYFENDGRVNDDLKDAKSALFIEKKRVLKLVEDIINDKTRQYVSKVYSEDRRSPILSLSQNSYTFSAIEDTGTGKAYSNLILFDLAALETTCLPFVIHDSILYKNIQNEAVARLVKLYISLGKQTFIAIDEIKKYGQEAERLLLDNKVIKLSDDHVLYIKDWRK